MREVRGPCLTRCLNSPQNDSGRPVAAKVDLGPLLAQPRQPLSVTL
jgi:hypothetical protein